MVIPENCGHGFWVPCHMVIPSNGSAKPIVAPPTLFPALYSCSPGPPSAEAVYIFMGLRPHTHDEHGHTGLNIIYFSRDLGLRGPT